MLIGKDMRDNLVLFLLESSITNPNNHERMIYLKLTNLEISIISALP